MLYNPTNLTNGIWRKVHEVLGSYIQVPLVGLVRLYNKHIGMGAI
jgi:hypothetical protein